MSSEITLLLPKHTSDNIFLNYEINVGSLKSKKINFNGFEPDFHYTIFIEKKTRISSNAELLVKKFTYTLKKVKQITEHDTYDVYDVKIRENRGCLNIKWQEINITLFNSGWSNDSLNIKILITAPLSINSNEHFVDESVEDYRNSKIFNLHKKYTAKQFSNLLTKKIEIEPNLNIT